jgi:hypothetical protein
MSSASASSEGQHCPEGQREPLVVDYEWLGKRVPLERDRWRGGVAVAPDVAAPAWPAAAATAPAPVRSKTAARVLMLGSPASSSLNIEFSYKECP